MSERTLRLETDDGRFFSALRLTPERPRATWIVAYAPGAGSNIHDPFGVHLCRALDARGVASLRFQFPYMEAGRRFPDRPPVLEAAWRAVIEAVRTPGAKLCVGGRSMGGRIASHVVAQGLAVDALALFAYPLHPPGRLDRMRDEHLPAIAARTLFCSGTNDAFATPDELRAAAAKVRGARVHLLEGADHGFAVPKATGRTRTDVYAEATEVLLRWLAQVGPRVTPGRL
jgi:predicted alpha/beta-hydrolase family hydrolase